MCALWPFFHPVFFSILKILGAAKVWPYEVTSTVNYIYILESSMTHSSLSVEVVRMTTDKPEEAATGADNTEGTESSGDSTADKDQEVVLIQDTGFNVKIVCPGVEEFELPVCCCYQIVFVVMFLLRCHLIRRIHTLFV